jgi:hypothetical protein
MLTRRFSAIAVVALAGCGSSSIARFLRKTMNQLTFQQVLNLAPPGSAQFRALDSGVGKDASKPAERARMYGR